MDELQKKKLADIRNWAESTATCYEKQMDPEVPKDIDRFTEFFKELSEDHKMLQAKTPAIARKAREFSRGMETKAREIETDLQGIIVILGELIKFLTFFRRKITRGTESGKVRAFLGAASDRHDELKVKAEALIAMVNELGPPEEVPGSSEDNSELPEEESADSE